jgi:hypothetical protein
VTGEQLFLSCRWPPNRFVPLINHPWSVFHLVVCEWERENKRDTDRRWIAQRAPALVYIAWRGAANPFMRGISSLVVYRWWGIIMLWIAWLMSLGLHNNSPQVYSWTRVLPPHRWANIKSSRLLPLWNSMLGLIEIILLKIKIVTWSMRKYNKFYNYRVDLTAYNHYMRYCCGLHCSRKDIECKLFNCTH